MPSMTIVERLAGIRSYARWLWAALGNGRPGVCSSAECSSALRWRSRCALWRTGDLNWPPDCS
jgi:hypothetical protein